MELSNNDLIIIRIATMISEISFHREELKKQLKNFSNKSKEIELLRNKINCIDEIKNKSISRILSSNYSKNLIQVIFEKAIYPDKLSKTKFCNKHKKEFKLYKENAKENYINKTKTFYFKNRGKIESCRDCKCKTINDYYSNFRIKIGGALTSDYVVFLTCPYIVLKKQLGNKKDFYKVDVGSLPSDGVYIEGFYKIDPLKIPTKNLVEKSFFKDYKLIGEFRNIDMIIKDIYDLLDLI